MSINKKAYELGVKTIAFCAIGTGGKGLNQHDAAKCAVDTVLECGKSFDKVCFNVFTDISEHAYRHTEKSVLAGQYSTYFTGMISNTVKCHQETYSHFLRDRNLLSQ